MQDVINIKPKDKITKEIFEGKNRKKWSIINLISNSINLHKKRLFIVWSRKILSFIKILSFTLFCLFAFTEFFQKPKNYIKNTLYNGLYKLGFKLEEIIISGRKNVKLDDVIFNIDSDNILLLDLEKIHTELKTNKWIDDLIISRKLPSSLEINIIEKTPIAIYQYKKKLYLVDKNGDTISEDIGNFKNLIHAIGYNANIHISNLINILNEYEDIKKNIVYVSRYGDRRWNLVLKNNIVIKLPEGNIKESMEYLKNLYDSQKLFERNIEYIDMRNATRYYIKYTENK